ncbi:hypothetical protein H9660_01580 [Clostridium sp. Sa3CUN1]|uniref:Uncharacterized protein n=1 Tax=Clostridium gallinarum TaxID=2762246 RepID=A0ABR8Q083_9CLOT|nr:DUF6198 family protein [Clostridium gallinarum]MBD7913829.1 hypothetical protein [Clostridium gallinarum]
MKKIKISSELIYILAIIILGFSVNLMSIADYGMSMIVCPAYILSLRFDFLTYGQAEYIVAGIVFVLFCIIMKQFKFSYLSSFITGILYATVADIFKVYIPMFHNQIPLSTSIRIICFLVGMILSGLAIAMFYNTYFYPQIYDFFVKVMSKKYKVPIKIFKTFFDCVFLFISILLSLVSFHKFVGIGLGTIIMAFCNGIIISTFQSMIEKYFICIPLLKKLYFYLQKD